VYNQTKPDIDIEAILQLPCSIIFITANQTAGMLTSFKNKTKHQDSILSDLRHGSHDGVLKDLTLLLNNKLTSLQTSVQYGKP